MLYYQSDQKVYIPNIKCNKGDDIIHIYLY